MKAVQARRRFSRHVLRGGCSGGLCRCSFVAVAATGVYLTGVFEDNICLQGQYLPSEDKPSSGDNDKG